MGSTVVLTTFLTPPSWYSFTYLRSRRVGADHLSAICCRAVNCTLRKSTPRRGALSDRIGFSYALKRRNFQLRAAGFARVGRSRRSTFVAGWAAPSGRLRSRRVRDGKWPRLVQTVAS